MGCPKHGSRTIDALVIGAVVLSHACATGSARAQDPSTKRSAFEQLSFADQLFAEEEFDCCVLEYRRFLFFNPADSASDRVRYKLGLCLIGLERWDAAQAVFGQLVERSGERRLVEAALFSSGTCYDRQGEGAAARLRYRSVAREFPEGGLADDAQLMLALTYVDDQCWLDAATEFGILAREFRQSPLAPVAARLAAESAKGIDLPHRSVRMAGVLSAVLPGAGQAWCGRPADGFFSLIFTCTFSALAIQSYRHHRESSACVLGALGLSFYVGGIHGAVNSAEGFNARYVDRFQARLRTEAAAAFR